MQPMSTRAIVLWGVVVVGSGLAALAVLWWRYGVGADVNVKLDLIRTAGGVMVVTGGAVTLLLAARRQRSTEQTLEHPAADVRAPARGGPSHRTGCRRAAYHRAVYPGG